MSKYIVLFVAIMILILAGNGKTAATHRVDILQSMKFSPATLTVKQGDTVVWTNKSSMLHNVVSTSAKMRSKMLKKDESYQFIFNDSGEFDYICEPHRAHMKGKIKVEK